MFLHSEQPEIWNIPGHWLKFSGHLIPLQSGCLVIDEFLIKIEY